MLNRIFKNTVRMKYARCSVRKFFRKNYDIASADSLNMELKITHYILMNLYKSSGVKRRIFNAIQIQTYAGCNLSCPFCPANKPGVNLYGGALPGEKIDFALFKNIANQLSALKFKGRITLSLMNEPLIDERLPDLTSLVRGKCPDAFLHISTNGSLLNEKLAIELIKAGIDEMYVNDYTNDNLVLKRLSGMSLSKKYKSHITAEKRSLTEILTNRAGNVKIYPSLQEPLRIPCVRPFGQMFVAFDGRVIQCCQDWEFTQIMGDTKKETLLDIWNNETYCKLRNKLRNFDRAGNCLCSKCNFGGLW